MKKLFGILCVITLILSIASNGFALSVLGANQNYALSYGRVWWNNMTSALNVATDNNFDTVTSFNNLAEMFTYDAIWLDTRETTSTLGVAELDNITAFIATGRRAVLIGENYNYTDWNQQIVGFGGGAYSGATSFPNPATTTSIISNELTNGAPSLLLRASGVVDSGGTSLYDINFATLWGSNVLSVLDVGVFSDFSWNEENNGVFATNVANWVANSGSPAPVPEPSTFLLLGGGLIGLAWYGRKRKQA